MLSNLRWKMIKPGIMAHNFNLRKQEFKASLGYAVSVKLARATRQDSKKKKFCKDLKKKK